MTRLQRQIQRLYQPLSTARLALEGPVSEAIDSDVRAMVLGLAQPADWGALGVVWSGVQSDLDLPAPGIAVNGVDALELWFSLAEPVSLAEAWAFLYGLCSRYLPDVKHARLRLMPMRRVVAQQAESGGVPPQQIGEDRWSAFVVPDLAAVFADDPALDMSPGEDAQADLLSRLVSMRRTQFHTALDGLVQDAPASLNTNPQQQASVGADIPNHSSVLDQGGLSGPFQDARLFLMAVMNNNTVPLVQRIEAARALLDAGPGVQG